jgi:hypothetical protein
MLRHRFPAGSAGRRPLAAGPLLAAALLLAPVAAAAQHVFPLGGGSAASAGFGAEATVGGITAGGTAGTGFSASAGFRASLPTNAPQGVLPPVTALAGADVAVTALLTDDIQVVSATLKFRPGGDAAFTEVPMVLTDANTGEWSATVPGTALDVRGLQYFVEASDGVNVASVPPTAPAAGLQTLVAQVTDHPAFDLPAATYVLAGAPLNPDDADPLEVFDELGGFDPAVWRYGTFDPGAGGYREAGSAAPALPGQGFWVIAAAATPVAVSGRTTDLSTPFEILLQPGFNQIANPFAFPVDFADVSLPAGADANLIGWNGVAYVNGVTTLAPATGYWIFHGGPDPAPLSIPPLGTGVARAAPGSVAPGVAPADDERAWGFVARAEADGRTDDDNRFGVREGATSGRDALDFADAPPPPAGYAVVSLVDAEGRRLLTDWRPPGIEGARWTLRLDTDRVGVAYRVEIERERALPDGWGLLAWPVEGGDPVELTEGGVLSGTVVSTLASREWILAAGPPAYLGAQDDELREGAGPAVTSFAFGRPYPNPARASVGTSFELSVPHGVRARVSIFDVSGRRVADLVDGPLEPGTHVLRWDGRDSRGSRVASGVYFVRARAGSFSHRGKVVVLE